MVSVALPGIAATTIDVVPGSLSDALKGLPSDETSLVLTGEAGMSDLLSLRELPAGVREIDMKGLRIVGSTLEGEGYYGVTRFAADELPDYVFANVNITSITLPASISRIGNGAFAGSGLKRLVIPSNVKEIGDYAFSGLPSLEYVSGGDGLTSIGKGCFSNCTDLVSVDLSASALTRLPERAFSGSTSLAALLVPAGIREVGSRVISGTALSSINLQYAEVYDDYALAGAESLQEAILNKKAEYGEGVMMSDASLTVIPFGPGVIPPFTYSGCDILDPFRPMYEATEIGEGAFIGNECKYLVFGPLVSRIESRTFASLPNLINVDVTKLEDRVPALSPDAFGDLDRGKIELYVKKGTRGLWQSDPEWGQFLIVEGQSVDVAGIDGKEGLVIGVRGDMIEVESRDVIEHIIVYNLDGMKLLEVSPADSRVEISTRQLGDNDVLLVRARSHGEIKTAKFVLR